MRKIPPSYTDPTPLFRHGGASRRSGQQLLDFSASINPLGPPESVLRALRDHLPDIAHYPDPHCRELTERLAQLHGVPSECVLVGNGSNELIYAIARALRPRRVAIAEPTYTEYLRASLLVGAEVDHWLAEGEKFTFEPFDPGAAELVWLCDPNSPTGGGWPLYQTLEWFKTQPSTTFVVDEAFRPFVLPKWPSHPQFASGRWGKHTEALPNLIVLRSMTKWFGIPGIRLGYLIAGPKFVSQFRAEMVPWSVNHLAQSAAMAALSDTAFQRQTEHWLEQLDSLLDATGDFEFRLQRFAPLLKPIPSGANFVLVRLHNTTARELCSQLVDYGIAIRDASNFVGLDEHYVRITVRLPAENERLFAALKEILT